MKKSITFERSDWKSKSVYKLFSWHRCYNLLIIMVLLAFPVVPAINAMAANPSGLPLEDSATGYFGFDRELVDGQKLFHSMTNHSSQMDSTGHPHIAYGGDALYYLWHDGTSWRYEMVDNSPGVGAFASMDLDSKNMPHISYYDAHLQTLKYAWKDAGIWNVQMVEAPAVKSQPSLFDDAIYTALSTESTLRPWYELQNHDLSTIDIKSAAALELDGVGLFTSIAIDPFNHPAISYYDAENGDLKYAYWNGSTWEISTADSTGNVGMYSSLGIDSAGNPWISYFDETNGNLKYATRSGSTWKPKVVDDGGDEGTVGLYTSLALDSSNNVYVSYYDETQGDLKYAIFSGGAWNKRIADSGGDVGKHTSIAVDSKKNIHISYYKVTEDDLRYAKCTSSSCTEATIPTGETYASATSIVLNDTTPGITYFDAAAGKLKYATKSSTGWVIHQLDSTADVGQFASLDYDSSGAAHIAYFDDVSDDLKYAFQNGSVWEHEIVDAPGEVGFHASLSVDSQGIPHIAYYDGLNGNLKYAKKVAGDWSISTVDNSKNDVGEYSSLALNSADQPRIAYYDDTIDALKLALWTGSSWLIKVVHEGLGAGVGRYASLAIDSQDYIHIGYYDAENGRPLYVKRTPTGDAKDKPVAIDDSKEVGLFIRLALYEDRPYVTYFEDYGDNLKFAYLDGATWRRQYVDTGVAGWNPSIHVDGDGSIHISYYDHGGERLLYAVSYGSGWFRSIVDDTCDVGRFSSVKLNGAGNAAIAYYDTTNGDLKFATAYALDDLIYLPVLGK